MHDYTGEPCPAQPISEVFKRILLGVVANASPKSEQKELIIIMHENGLISAAETFALIHIYGLAGT